MEGSSSELGCRPSPTCSVLGRVGRSGVGCAGSAAVLLAVAIEEHSAIESTTSGRELGRYLPSGDHNRRPFTWRDMYRRGTPRRRDPI